MRRNSRKNNNDENSGGSPAWMTTFGDMMTLLLVFFVLLYSFSVMDLEKFKGFISALQNQLGVLESGKTLSEETMVNKGSMGKRFNPAPENITEIMGKMKSYVKKKDLEDKINMEITKRGLVVRFSGEVLYEIGEAVIKPEGKKILSEVVKNIKDIPNSVAVEGHTDSWPINNENFPSNWELSTTRAVNVIKYFIEKHDINPQRLSAAGYSKYRPLYENNTSVRRAKNRRVEVVILNSTYKNVDREGK